MSYNFMAAVIICSDYAAQENKSLYFYFIYTVSPSICHGVMQLDTMILSFWNVEF